MKLNKTLTLAALVAVGLFAGSTALPAQDAPATPPPGNQAGPGRGHPDFAKELNLTDDQKTKFKSIMQDAMTKQQALRADTSLSQEDKRAKAKAIHEDTTTKMKALLTDEQFAKWQKMSQHQRPAHGTPPAGGDQPPK